MNIELHIAGYVARLRVSGNRSLLAWPLSPFKPFLINSGLPSDIDCTVHVVKCLPDMPRGRLVFDACHGLWSLYETKSGFLLDSADPKTLKLRSRSIISDDYSSVEVWLRERRSGLRIGWTPMQVINPVIEMCLLTRIARARGLLLHSSGVLVGDQGWLFLGPSGAGKSTLSDLFAAKGASVLSDERIIVRRTGGDFSIFGTPWIGNSRHAKNSSGLLTQVFCIRHGTQRHVLHRPTPRTLSQVILEQCFLPYWDREGLQSSISTISDLIEQVDCCELAFLKDPDIVDFLRHQDIEPLVRSA